PVSGRGTMTIGIQDAGEPGVIRPVQRPVPLRQSVYESLVELVINGRLKPGQHLAETELARLLGVSRQPVREALHRLAAGGWVDLRPNQGAFVHVPTHQEVDELLDVRELLEMETARLAARAAGPQQMAWLREICREGEAAIKAGDTERFVAVNNQFHAPLAELAGKAGLAQLAEIGGRPAPGAHRRVGPAARGRVVRRAHGAGRGHRGRGRGAGREGRPRAHRAHPHRLPPPYCRPGVITGYLSAGR